MTELAARQHVTAFEAMGRLETYSKVALRIAKQAGDALFVDARSQRARCPR